MGLSLRCTPCRSLSPIRRTGRPGTGVQWSAQGALRPLPRRLGRCALRCRLTAQLFESRGENRRHRGDLGAGRVAPDDGDLGTEGGASGDRRLRNGCFRTARDGVGVSGVGHHRGMFPCFFGGRLARLVLRARNAFTTVMRVAAGSITPSSSPRSAARKGEATL
jgi:hypothetical protein